jgi:Na+/melibiose symporter-like transporter
MLPLEFFKSPRFSMGSGAITLAFFALFGATFFLTQYQQSVRGYSPLGAGVRILPVAGALVFSASRSAKRVARFGTKRVVAMGMFFVALGFGSLSLFTADTSYWALALVYALVGFGMGNVVAPSTESIMGSLPRNRAGVGSAVNDTTRQVGGALGVAVLGSLLSSGYAAKLGPAVRSLPANLRAQATDRLEAALGIAQKTHNAALARAAKVAFTDAMGTVALAAAVIALIGMVGVLVYLPARAHDDEGLPAFEEAIVEESPDGPAAVAEPEPSRA